MCLFLALLFFIFSSVLGLGKGGGVRGEKGGSFMKKNRQGGRVSEEGRRGGACQGLEGVAGREGG